MRKKREDELDKLAAEVNQVVAIEQREHRSTPLPYDACARIRQLIIVELPAVLQAHDKLTAADLLKVRVLAVRLRAASEILLPNPAA